MRYKTEYTRYDPGLFRIPSGLDIPGTRDRGMGRRAGLVLPIVMIVACVAASEFRWARSTDVHM